MEKIGKISILKRKIKRLKLAQIASRKSKTDRFRPSNHKTDPIKSNPTSPN